MISVYEYDTRFIVDNNGSRYSYSKKRYGSLINMVITQTELYERKIQNPFIIVHDTTILYYWLQKENKIHEILIDTDDYDQIKDYYWGVRSSYNNYYASNRSQDNQKNKHLHRFLMDTPDHLIVDHINRNGLDNRKNNLRNVEPYVNSRNKAIQKNNTSGVIGVDYQDGQWRVRWATSPYHYACKYFKNFEEAVEHRKMQEKHNEYL